ncbi:MAG TPA: LamG-like jellyroll fold domain-containing protein [Candidatus Aquilonibacter sp.]|nr:LamG-like jellyroll fold domain-containing protein [Candidatus Aquilonibacter sp.]
MKLVAAAAILALAVPALAVVGHAEQAVTWRFDNLSGIGGAQVTTVGNPKVVDTPIGKAIHFEGHGNPDPNNPESGNPLGDALFLDTAPLSGFATYTFEVIFRPSSQGALAQRFFHMQDLHSQSRRMFEIRIRNHQWCLDTVGIDQRGNAPEQHGVTLACDAAHLHSLDRWHVVAATYDGKTLRGYVDGELQGEIAIALQPLPPGHASVGTRIDKRDFFTGDIYSARFTPRVVSAADFLKVPGSDTQ